ncbi:hypothetical protein Tco_1183721 [Tanacetum coccineum]
MEKRVWELRLMKWLDQGCEESLVGTEGNIGYNKYKDSTLCKEIEGQPVACRTKIQESPKKLNAGFATIGFTHHHKGHKFGKLERIEARDVYFEVVYYLTKEFSKRNPKVGKSERMSV